MTSLLVAGGPSVRRASCGSREVVALSSSRPLGRWKNPAQSSSLLCFFSWSSDESSVCIESRRVFRRSSSPSVFANSTSSSDPESEGSSSVGGSLREERSPLSTGLEVGEEKEEFHL